MFKLGHVLIKVDNLELAVIDFRRLGFTVTMGGLPGKTHNALIYLEDGTFIELYDASVGKLEKIVPILLKIIKKVNPKKAYRYQNYLMSKEGMNDYAFDSIEEKNFKTNINYLKNNGVKLLKITNKKRVDATGCKRKWPLCFPEDYHFPFFMGAYQPQVIITNNQKTHINKVEGIHSLRIGVTEYDYFIDNYKIISNDYSIGNFESHFNFGSSYIIIEKSEEFGIKELQLKGKTNEILSSELTHGAMISVIESSF